MPVILVVEQDASFAERISEALQSDDLSVEIVGSRAEASSLAESRQPALLIASSALPRVQDLLGSFSRRRGGPGAVVLVPASAASQVSAKDFGADELLSRASLDELKKLVRRCLKEAAKRPKTPRPAAESEQLSSADIFGDVLAEVEAEVQGARPHKPRKPARPMDDIERKLEETLSGVLPLAGRENWFGGSASIEGEGSPRRRAAPARESETESEVAELLDQTLSSLNLATRSRKPAAPVPVVETPAVAPAAASRVPPVRPAGAARALAALSEMKPEDLFRTQALPKLDLLKEMAGGEIFGDYTLLDRIALGGMAEVWRARRRGVEGFQKTVAIKKILSHLTGSQDFVTMFIDEAKLAAQLNHNNIIQIYDLGKVGSDFFIAMEHVDGKDLRSILTAAEESNRPVPMGLGLFIVCAVARALDYAHRKRDFDNRAMGLVHRDVSPQNVLISYEGEIKLCDFGIVKAVAKAGTTQMGALKGKLQYMSPEQAWGKAVDARSDIFSLGSVLFEILTGSKLFSGETEIGVLDAVRECRTDSVREIVPTIPDEVDRIVRRALAKTPEERYQTAGDMEHEIEEVLDHLKSTPGQKDLAAYVQDLATLSPPEVFAPPPPVVAEATAETPPPTASPGIGDVADAVPDAVPDAVADPPAEAEKAGGRNLKWLVAAIIVILLLGAGTLAWRSMKEHASPAGEAPSPAVIEPGIDAEESTAAGDDGEAVTESGEPAADGGDATAEAQEAVATDSPVFAAGIDIEQMVNDELTSRAERLRRDFEAEKKRIEKELAKTQAPTPPPAVEEPRRDDGDEETSAKSGGGL